MRHLAADLRFAIRSLARTPGFTAVAILSVAIAIGANTSVFSLVNAIHFRPVEFPDPATLVDVHEESATQLCAGCGVGTSYPGFRDWQERATSFTGLAGYGEQQFSLSDDGASTSAARINVGLVTHNLFPLLGVTPVLGRPFAPDEDRVGVMPVALLGHELWLSRFAGDTAIIGRTVRLSGVAHTVIGIMPAGFKYPEFAELWVPLTPLAHADPRDNRGIGVVGRLAKGRTLAQADAEMRAIARALEAAYPETQKEWAAGVSSVQADRAAETGNAFLILLGAVSFVLLIACANLASFFLARVGTRGREMAVRAAMGASRLRLVGLVVAESVLVALAGGSLGMAMAVWGSRGAVSLIRDPIPYYIRFEMDWRVAVFCLMASLAAGLLFGIVPAWRASRPDLVAGLKDGARGTGGPGRQRLVQALTVAELALALMLLSGAGLLVKTFLRVTQPPSTFDATHVLRGELSILGDQFHDSARVARLADEVVARLERQPGVAAAISASRFIAGFGASDRRIQIEGMATPDGASPRFASAVTPAWFGIHGERIVQGRGFTSADARGAEPVVIVNQAFARRAWPDASVIGRRIALGPQGSGAPWRTIVGVVANEATGANGRPVASNAWVPFAQEAATGTVELSVRTSGDPHAYVATVRAEIRAVNADVPVERLRTVQEEMSMQYWPVRFFATLFAAFAGFAILLAAIGTYGILAHSVSQRTREIGVRLALGADATAITVMILRMGGALGAIGIVLGMTGSVALSGLIRGLLYGASTIDPVVLLGVTLAFAMLTLAASWIPARRAASVEPLVALRNE